MSTVILTCAEGYHWFINYSTRLTSDWCCQVKVYNPVKQLFSLKSLLAVQIGWDFDTPNKPCVFASPIVKCTRRNTVFTADVANFAPGFMRFNGFNDLFFCITFFHLVISNTTILMEISSMSWSYFWGIGQPYHYP